MTNLRLLRRAEADLEEARAWYEARSSAVARRFENAVTAALERIAATPELYALVDGQHRLCSVRKSQYVIVYRYEASTDEVLVVAVVHAKQDPSRWPGGS